MLIYAQGILSYSAKCVFLDILALFDILIVIPTLKDDNNYVLILDQRFPRSLQLQNKNQTVSITLKN